MSFDLTSPDWPAPTNVHAFTTCRQGGVSKGPWSSMNLGLHCGDAPEHVLQNRALLQQYLPASPHWMNQVHGPAVHRIESCDPKSAPAPVADAAVTEIPGAVCVMLTADCLPVCFTDAAGQEVAVAHAGWRGLLSGVLENTIAKMQAAPETLLCWLGPAIGPQHYAVGPEFREQFVGRNPATATSFVRRDQQWFADLFCLARWRLRNAGVEQIFGGDLCTASDGEKFFSYRRDGTCGRMATVIWRD